MAAGRQPGRSGKVCRSGPEGSGSRTLSGGPQNFEQLAKLEPNIAEVHATLAAIYFKQREYELSVHEVRTAQKLKPALPRLDSLLGLSLSELGQFEEALPRLEKGFKQTADPDHTDACAAFSCCARIPDSGAIPMLSKPRSRSTSSIPMTLKSFITPGRIYGNFAYVVMEKLHDKAPNSIWMLQAQGEANESQKDYDAAIIAFNHVLALDPRRPGIHYRLGRVYLARLQEFAKTGRPRIGQAGISGRTGDRSRQRQRSL